MSRDHRKLRVFHLADALAVRVYEQTRTFAADERFELRAQLRRSAISVPTNIVEGSARRTRREYVQFLTVAAGSLAELRYLADLSARLGLLTREIQSPIDQEAATLAAGLEALIRSHTRATEP